MTETQAKEVTFEMVGQKLRSAFNRIKAMWEDKNREIRKIESKMEKMNEQLFELKQEREVLENEIEGIRTTYEAFSDKTGVRFELRD